MSLTEQPPTAVRKLTGGQKSNLRRYAVRRDLPLKAKVKDDLLIVEQGNGIVFSFPVSAWPSEREMQWEWILRLTPWWDVLRKDWTTQAHRLRESCVQAINKVLLLCQHSS